MLTESLQEMRQLLEENFLRRDLGPMLRAEQRCLAGDVHTATDDEEQSFVSNWYNAVLPIAVTLGLVIYFIYDSGSRSVCLDAAETAIAAVPTEALAGELSTAADELQEAANSGDVSATQAAIERLAAQVEGRAGNNAADLAFQPSLGLRDIVGSADSSLALQYGALAGLIVAVVLPLLTRLMAVDQLMVGAANGARVVLPAVAILWTASAMSRMTTDKSVEGNATTTAYEFKDHRLYTAAYLTQALSGDGGTEDESTGALSVEFLPTIVFVLAAAVAFCTGTSWGTMGILVPMVVPLAHALLARNGTATLDANDPILLASIGGVLAGAVFGDHCSPISDTTVLSSQASGCDHLAHVWTQLPYAMAAASVAIGLGTLPIGFGFPVWLALPLQFAALIGIMLVFGRRAEETSATPEKP